MPCTWYHARLHHLFAKKWNFNWMLQVGHVKWHQLSRATNLWATCRVLWWLGLGICNCSQVQEILLKLSLIPESYEHVRYRYPECTTIDTCRFWRWHLHRQVDHEEDFVKHELSFWSFSASRRWGVEMCKHPSQLTAETSMTQNFRHPTVELIQTALSIDGWNEVHHKWIRSSEIQTELIHLVKISSNFYSGWWQYIVDHQ